MPRGGFPQRCLDGPWGRGRRPPYHGGGWDCRLPLARPFGRDGQERDHAELPAVAGMPGEARSGTYSPVPMAGCANYYESQR